MQSVFKAEGDVLHLGFSTEKIVRDIEINRVMQKEWTTHLCQGCNRTQLWLVLTKYVSARKSEEEIERERVGVNENWTDSPCMTLCSLLRKSLSAVKAVASPETNHFRTVQRLKLCFAGGGKRGALTNQVSIHTFLCKFWDIASKNTVEKPRYV